MDAAAEIGRNLLSKHQIQPEYRDEQVDADGTAEPVSRNQIFRREQGQGNIIFPCSADHEKNWQPYPVEPSSINSYVSTYGHHIYMSGHHI